jgi:hypothetical protein
MKRARAIMADANLPLNFRYRLYPEVIRTAAKLDSLLVINIRGIEKTTFQFFNNDKEPRWASKLRTWGEAGVVKLKDLATAKLEDHGRTCMFVGYAADHSADCYRMWDPLTSRLHVSRDVVWLRRMFFTKKVLGDDELVVVIPQVSDPGETCVTTGEGFDESDTDEESVEDIDGDEEQSELEEHQDNEGIRREHKTTTRSGRKIYSPQATNCFGSRSDNNLERGLRNLFELSLANICTDQICDISEMMDSRDFSPMSEFGLVGMGIGGGFDSTEELHVLTYEQAMQSSKHRE